MAPLDGLMRCMLDKYSDRHFEYALYVPTEVAMPVRHSSSSTIVTIVLSPLADNGRDEVPALIGYSLDVTSDW